MAAGDASPFPTKGKAWRVTFPIFDADGDLVTGATGLDSEISKNGGTFVDCTSEATEIATASGMYFLDLTAAEMDADTVAIIVKTTTAGAKTTPIVVYPIEIKEPAGVGGFNSGGTGLEEVLAWLFAMSRNKMTQTATTTTLRNDADTLPIATSTVSDDGTTFVRGEYS